ncbi:MAG: amidinotransferase [Flavobacteriales bacterium]|nr:amidinotransferase [Flavobacteriales bacterium]
MVRPAHFIANPETAVNNHFQQTTSDPEQTIAAAREEFDLVVEALLDAGIHVIVVEDTDNPITPDALFPNNWVSFHPDGRAALYPMYAANRRTERRDDILSLLSDGYGFTLEEVVDFTEFEEHDAFLEGTGSMVLDHVNHLCFACLSERTDEHAVLHFCEAFGYEPVLFEAFHFVHGESLPVYHTNVIMSIGTSIAIVCADAIPNESERIHVLDQLKSTGKELLLLKPEQMDNFAGNIIELQSADGSAVFAMSGSAFRAFSPEQRALLESKGKIVQVDIPTIETHGGGSVRCMIAEIFLPMPHEAN